MPSQSSWAVTSPTRTPWVPWFRGVGSTLRGHATLIAARREEEPEVSTPAPEQNSSGGFVATEELIHLQGTRPLRSVDDLASEDAFASEHRCRAVVLSGSTDTQPWSGSWDELLSARAVREAGDGGSPTAACSRPPASTRRTGLLKRWRRFESCRGHTCELERC